MLKTDKERIVSELAAEIGAADTLIVADYRGLTNKQLEALRDRLLEHGARFRIVKNTLTRRAAEQAGADALLVLLEGPTAIAFIESEGDPAAVAKALATTAGKPRCSRCGGHPRGRHDEWRAGRRARDAAAGRAASRAARRRDRRSADPAARARLGSAPRPARARRGPDRAARGAGRGRRAARVRGDSCHRGNRSKRSPTPMPTHRRNPLQRRPTSEESSEVAAEEPYGGRRQGGQRRKRSNGNRRCEGARHARQDDGARARRAEEVDRGGVGRHRRRSRRGGRRGPGRRRRRRCRRGGEGLLRRRPHRPPATRRSR